MRVFASLPIPADVRRDLQAALPAAPPGMRSIPAERWHLTLAFYGDVDPGCLQCIDERLAKRLVPPGPVVLKIDGAGRFGSQVAYLRVLGAGTGDTDRLRLLARTCRRVGLACDAPGTRQQERFRGHVTVGRAKRGGAVAGDFVDRCKDLVSRPWEADRVDLLSSHLGPTVRYELLRSFRLRDSPAPG